MNTCSPCTTSPSGKTNPFTGGDSTVQAVSATMSGREARLKYAVLLTGMAEISFARKDTDIMTRCSSAFRALDQGY
jgi:hypothetical protein